MILVPVMVMTLVMNVMVISIAGQLAGDRRLFKDFLESRRLYHASWAGVMRAVQWRQAASDISGEVSLLGNGYRVRVLSSAGGGFAESRFNVNTMNVRQAGVLRELLVQNGVGSDRSATIVDSILDWVDVDDRPRPTGEADEHCLQDDQIRCKNRPLDSLAELRLMRGMTPDIFEKIRDDLTVHPRYGHFLFHVPSVSPLLLQALLTAEARQIPGVNPEVARTLVAKMLDQREKDFEEEVRRDSLWTEEELRLGADEKVLYRAVAVLHQNRPQFFNVRVEVENPGATATAVYEAVIRADDAAVVAWKRRI